MVPRLVSVFEPQHRYLVGKEAICLEFFSMLPLCLIHLTAPAHSKHLPGSPAPEAGTWYTLTLTWHLVPGTHTHMPCSVSPTHKPYPLATASVPMLLMTDIP